MSRVAGEISNLGEGIFSEPKQFLKKNWENVYVFIWKMCITIILINFFKLDMSKDDNKKPVFKNVAIYEQFSNVCKNAEKNCPKNPGKKSCTYNDCCIWATSKSGTSCIKGDKDGPETENDPKGSKYDEYWFLKKKYKIN